MSDSARREATNTSEPQDEEYGMNRAFLQVLLAFLPASVAPSWVHAQSGPVVDEWPGTPEQKIVVKGDPYDEI